MENKDQSAFPVLELKEMGDKFLLDCSEVGISKREYFAGMALQGLMAGNYASDEELIAARAVKVADSLLTQLEKQ